MALDERAAGSLSEIRAVIGRRSGEQASALTAFGLLCASGADLRAVIRDVPDLIRQIFPVNTVGFFWCDAEGRMTDAYVEQPYFLSSDVLLSCQRYQEADPRNWPSFTENVLAGAVTGYLLPYQTPAFYASDHYAFTYERIDARHILDAVVHDGTPLGCFLFMRSAKCGPFSNEDVEAAGVIATLAAHAFQRRASAAPSTRLFHAGLVVFDQKDKVVFRNLRAHQSLWMLARAHGPPMHEALTETFDSLLTRLCSDLVRDTRNAKAGITIPINNLWGDFVVQTEFDEAGAVAIRFLQHRPLAAHLASELVKLNLPPRRLTVCWLALLGTPRKEIARLAEMSVDTVGEHLNALFAQFAVSTTQELAARFLA